VLAEADGNRTRQRQDLPLNGFEDRAGHQAGYASLCHALMISVGTGLRDSASRPSLGAVGARFLAAEVLRRRRDRGSMDAMGYRLTQYAHGGGCACKIPPGELEDVVRGLTGAIPQNARGELLVGLDDGDDAAVVRIENDLALIATTDFFTPVVDDPYDWGRIAAANALSDVYAMGGRPVVAVNLLGWPREVLPFELAAETLRGGLDICGAAGCHLAGGHSVDDPEPKYGLAVTGLGEPDRLLRNDAGKPGIPLSLTKPLGIGVLNSRHKATGERFDEAIEVMTTLNAGAATAALAAGITCATDVTGFGLLGHLHKLARASGVTAIVDATKVSYVDGARAALAAGFVSGGTRRNLDWVRPHADLSAISEDEALLLADAQTSGGLLVAGEIPGAPVIGELVPRGEHIVIVR
jgi:selenide,water dikinase